MAHSMPRSSQFKISTTTPDGAEHSLRVEDDRVVLGTGDWATPIVVSPDAAGHVTLSLIDHRGLEVDGQRLRLLASAATPFVPEPVSPMANHLYLRTRDGLYLTAPTPGEPVLLAAQPGPAAMLRLRPTALVRPLWGADFGQWNNENRSTHLWIFNRAVELIRATPRLAPGQLELLGYLDDATFVKSVKQGIDAADNEGGPFSEYSGVFYSAHFYNPRTQTNYLNQREPNALDHGLHYLQQSMTEFDPAVAGKSLGLAIHYLEDLTQPMHSGLFINVPGSPHPGMRREAYERWMFSQQDRCVLAVSELKLDEFQDFDFRRYFEHAAWQSLAEFEKWVGVATSPIGVFSDFSSSQNWLPVASRMLKLAQRLVAGLLLSWRPAERWDSRTQADVPGKARWISAGGDQSLYAVNDCGQLYQSRRPSARGRSWVLRLAGMDGLQIVVAIDAERALAVTKGQRLLLLDRLGDEGGGTARPVELRLADQLPPPGAPGRDNPLWLPPVSVKSVCIGPSSVFVVSGPDGPGQDGRLYRAAKQDVVGGVPVVPLFAEHDDYSSLAGVAAGLDPTGQLEEVWGVTSDNRVLRGRATGPYASGSLSLRAPERIGQALACVSVGPGQCPTIAGVDAEGGVFRCIKSSHWQQIGEGKAMLSVGRDQGLWMIDQEGTVCMKELFQVRPVTTLSKVTLKTGDRIALRSDNGKYLSRVTRCDGHVVMPRQVFADGTIVEAIEAFDHGITTFSMFTVSVLAGGKIALLADNGKYLSRVRRSLQDRSVDPIEAYADAINEFTQFTLGGEQGRFVLTSDASGRRRYLQRINRGTRDPIEMWQEKPHGPSLFTIHPVPLE